MNITGAVLILLVSLSVTRPLDFAVFPSLLLVATMFRLALNVSATRLVLLNGFAGKVIESFGHFVVGGSLVVGLVIFVILVVIQFVVITNGAGRVAEVAARFTLDAMPGKQMAIDADLNSGLIDEDKARRRRHEVSAEADFYGAMDGASKFVKGDAIAAIVITLVNLFGGFFVGVVQRHQSMADAISTYSLLSVGDGLVSQIPALLISISTGLIVTRATTERDMGSDLLHQFGQQRRAFQIAGAAILLLALVPGLPKLPFLLVGARRPAHRPAAAEQRQPETVEAEAAAAAAARRACPARTRTSRSSATCGSSRSSSSSPTTSSTSSTPPPAATCSTGSGRCAASSPSSSASSSRSSAPATTSTCRRRPTRSASTGSRSPAARPLRG